MCLVPHQGISQCCLLSFLLLKSLYGSLGRERYEGILTLHILLSQSSNPRRKMSYPQIKKCKCVGKIFLNLYYTPFVDMISLAFYFETGLSFFHLFMSLHVLIFFLIPWDLHVSLFFSFSSWTFMCSYFFLFHTFAQPMSLKPYIERDQYFVEHGVFSYQIFFCLLLVQEQSFGWMDACFSVFRVQEQLMYVGVRDLDLGA